MKELIFRCELLSDIVLNASGASEGRLPSHDFIPGSNFLGIVARKYKDAGDMAYELFHSGKVRFGDAHIMLDGERSHKVSADWFFRKGTKLEDGVYLHHKLMENNLYDKLLSQGIQPKQARSGFFIAGSNGIVLADLSGSKQYSMKSAYNRQKRRAADKQLFGYTALQPGSVWEFSVCLEDSEQQDERIEFIKENLIGKRNVGRSRSAQYGLVNITEHANIDRQTEEKNYTNEVTVYAESRLSFLDEFGQPTFQPTPEQLGFSSGTIIWEKSQILISRYAPWNRIRQTRDADRVCIDKGSVFVIRFSGSVSLPDKLRGLGIYTNEGFGEALVNPDFLQSNSSEGKLEKPISIYEEAGNDTPVSSTSPLVAWLGRQSDKDINNRFILEKINLFVEKNSHLFCGKFASQWGAVRDIASQATDKDDLLEKLFKVDPNNPNDSGYLMHGMAVEKWQKENRRAKLREFLYVIADTHPDIILPLVTKLASEMAKAVSMNQQQNEEVE
jgi:hypothetical protein